MTMLKKIKDFKWELQEFLKDTFVQLGGGLLALFLVTLFFAILGLILGLAIKYLSEITVIIILTIIVIVLLILYFGKA